MLMIVIEKLRELSDSKLAFDRCKADSGVTLLQQKLEVIELCFNYIQVSCKQYIIGRKPCF